MVSGDAEMDAGLPNVVVLVDEISPRLHHGFHLLKVAMFDRVEKSFGSIKLVGVLRTEAVLPDLQSVKMSK